MPQQKSVGIAYACWLFSGFGVLGGHQFYLGDDRKAFLYLTSLGGFGLAALRDLWMIPTYCRDDKETNPKRKSFFLLFGAFCFAYLYAKLFAACYNGFAAAHLVGDYWYVPLALRSLGAALGSHVVLLSGNRISRASFGGLFAVATLVQLAVHFKHLLLPAAYVEYVPSALTTAALSAAAWGYKFRVVGGRWRGTQSRLVWRLTRLAMAVTLIMLVASFALLYNAEITVENTNGEGTTKRIDRLRDVNFDELSFSDFQAYVLYAFLDMDEIRRFTLDGPDESDAFEELGLEEGATMREVKTRFRKLAIELHPDKATNKQEAEEKFTKVQAAYALLIKKYGRTVEDQNKPAEQAEEGKDEL